MRHPILTAAVLGLAVSSPAIAGAQVRPAAPATPVAGIPARTFGTVDGIVSDSSLAPLQGAFVSLLGTNVRIGTGPNGRFRITKLPTGKYILIVKRVGFRPISGVIEVPDSDTLRLSYEMERAEVQLNPVVVAEKAPSIRLRGFEERKRLGQGEFMAQQEIDARNSVYSTELFRKFKSVVVSPSHTSAIAEYYPLSAREGGSISTGACPMQVVLDDVPLPTPFNLDLLPPPKDIAGIEAYAGSSTVPLQYSGMNRGCGVILVWTRSGSP